MDRFKLFKKDLQLGRKRIPIQSQSAWTCKICKTASAKYTCPRCNLPYCSLDCYKSEKHGECTESFYKDCVMDRLKNQNVSAETKKKMEETLKKMSDETENEADILHSEHEGKKPVDLAERLRGMDLDTDVEKIWDCLTEDEKKEFEQFLTSGNLSEVIELWEPWWMSEISHPKIVEIDASDVPIDRTDIPTILPAPDLSSLFGRHPPADSVIFSCLNLLYSYVLMARVFNGDHAENCEAAADSLLEMSAGLRGDRVFSSAEESIIVATSEADASSIRALVESRELKAAAMADGVRILEERVFMQAAFSDVIALLKKAWKTSGGVKKFVLAFKKVEYFMAFLEGREDAFRNLIVHVQRQQAEFVEATLEQDIVQTTIVNPMGPKKMLIQEI